MTAKQFLIANGGIPSTPTALEDDSSGRDSDKLGSVTGCSTRPAEVTRGGLGDRACPSPPASPQFGRDTFANGGENTVEVVSSLRR